MPRGFSGKPRKRNSVGSMPAAAASSSMKLSTAKTELAGLPGQAQRRRTQRRAAVTANCTTTRMWSAV